MDVILLVVAFVAALRAVIPVDVISLFYSLMQTLISVLSLVQIGEGFYLINSVLVVVGAHGWSTC